MIRNQWYAILESSEVKAGHVVGVTRLAEKLVLWRNSRGELACMADKCPHRGAALSAGKVVHDNVQCPFHGFEYDASGQCTVIPANGLGAPVPKSFQVRPAYPVREANDFIYIWWGEPRADLPAPPFFDSVDHKAFSWLTLRDHWATHYSRAIENQLDVVHLPFVHHNTIGRGNRTIVNGPISRLESQAGGGEVINVWVNNQVDTGQAPLRASGLPEPARRPFVQFLFPNLWHNWISDDMRIVLAFVPIDDENTMMYIRNYQRMVRLPVLNRLFDLAGLLGSFVVERQDRRVVITQQPKRSDIKIGERVIPGDGPIVAYRRRRSELIEAAA
ncbi:MAG: aromatic ring-hydroxylating dioxygenase subunit alpha [Thermoflexales bacterium]|nr:aromatic ring-hydroxylating dioxygenase subunit alpha [Thermoflexales bacterium]